MATPHSITQFKGELRQCPNCGKELRVPPAKAKRGPQTFCSRRCCDESKFTSSERIKERFWSKVKKTETCWLWQGHCGFGGYGRFHLPRVDKRPAMEYAHRFAYFLTHGNLPKGRELHIAHKCDVPACCNPDHLFLATIQENMADKVIKGRTHCGNQNPARQHPEKLSRGEKHHNATLTEDDIRSIRSQYSSGNITHTELSKQFNVSVTHIGLIIRRKKWKHVL